MIKIHIRLKNNAAGVVATFFLVFCILLGMSVLSPAHAGLLYVLNDSSDGNQIYGFRVDESTGALTPLSGFPFADGELGDQNTVSERLFYDSANSRLYVVDGGSNTVSAYSVDQSTGALTALPFSPISLPAGIWLCLAVHPGGSPLVVGGSNSAASFSITATTATAAAGSPFDTGAADPFSCAFSRDGNYFYAGGDSGSSFAGFSVDTGTGVLTGLAGTPFDSVNDYPLAYATDLSGRLFLTNWNTNDVRVFTTSSGVPAAASGNPFPSGLSQGIQGILHPSGFYMVADRGSDQVGVYQISGTGAATTLTAVAGSPFLSGGSFTDALALNASGNFLFAANGLDYNITTFAVNTSTGVLSGATTQPQYTLGDAGIITGIAYAADPPAPTAVPTVTEWGSIIFLILAGLGSVYYLKKQNTPEN